MNKNVIIGGGIGLLIVLFFGGYWISMDEPQQQAAVRDTTSARKTPPVAGDPNPASVQPGIPPVLPLAQSLSSPTSESGTGTAAPFSSASIAATPGIASSTQPIESADKKPLSRQERQKIRAQIDIKTKQLLAKGQNVTSADTQAYLDDVEKLGQGLFDPKYFSVMREIVGYSDRIQDLGKEFNQISKSQAPKDVVRQRAILAEMRDISDRIIKGATAMQSYAQDAAKVKTP